MNAPLLKLHCPVCLGTQESMTILLPKHEVINLATTRLAPVYRCSGSNTLAFHFVDTCPACENHGRRQDCVICHGKNKVLTPINIEIEWNGGKDHFDWQPVTLEQARKELSAFFPNPDDVISALYSGQPANTVWHQFRVKPRVNVPQEISNGQE